MPPAAASEIPHPAMRLVRQCFRHAAALLAALIPGACAPQMPASDPAPGPPTGNPPDWRAALGESKRPKVLFVGNSYTNGMPEMVRQVARDHGVKLRVDQVAPGGWTLRQHADSAETLETIRRGDWDLIVFQEQSRLLSLTKPRRSAESLPAIRSLAEEARAVGAVPALYRTWGRRDGDADAPRAHRPDDFSAMHTRLTRGYREASEAAGGLPVLPVGDAWAHEVRAGRGERLFREDGSHPTDAGVELTARTIFFTCFPEIAEKPGVSPPPLAPANL